MLLSVFMCCRMTGRFAVISFVETNMVGIVPKSWLTKQMVTDNDTESEVNICFNVIQ